MNSNAWHVAILVLLVAAVGCSSKKDETESTSAAEERASLIASSNNVPALKVEDLGKLVDLFVAEANRLPRAEFDPAALVALVSKDPQKLQDWVRNHTYWAPHHSLMRRRGIARS